MKKSTVTKRLSSVIAAFALAGAIVSANAITAAAESADDTQVIITQYADLWESSEITAQAGKPVKWYVVVPDDVTPKGCGATVKIPGLGFGTDTHNKEEGHIVLQQGENFIYEFTPEETGDILFTCWMGSGCHKNYIHITEPEVIPEEEETATEDEQAQTDETVLENDSEEKETTSDTAANKSDNEDKQFQEDTDNENDDAEAVDASDDKDDNAKKSKTKTESTATTSGSSDKAAAQTSSNPKTGSFAGTALAASVILAGTALTLGKKAKR